jgi:hypothetical protein
MNKQTSITNQLETQERAQMFVMSKLITIKRRRDEVILGALESVVDEEAIADVITSYDREIEMLEYINESI